MQNIKEIFIDEGNDLVTELESLLIDLESEGASEDIVNGIFRIMHSLKGGSAMFGFQKLDQLTHNLETIYNKIRDDKALLSQTIIDITFKSVDLIKDLLSETISEEVSETTDILVQKILLMIEQFEDTKDKPETESKKEIKENTLKSYYVLFQPEEDILSNGTNPLYIVEELVDLSEDSYVIVRNNNVPSLENFNTDCCYTWWELILFSSENLDELQSVFMFVENDAEIEIKELAPENILENSEVKHFLEVESSKNHRLDVTQMIGLCKKAYEIDQEQSTEGVAENSNDEFESPDNKSTAQASRTLIHKNESFNIKVSSQKLDELMNMVSELVTTQARLQMFSDNTKNAELSAITEDITKITRRLRDNAFSIILIPIESILVKFRRLVRDLSMNLEKTIHFVTHGTDTELDKTIIETINEPLLHLIRNAIDHGIETREERLRLGKPEYGTITLKSFHSGSNVHIQISDDGSGIDVESIRKKAIEKDVIQNDSQLSNKEIIDLIWLPGFSTAKEVSELSGRGVGMDVVKKKISDVRGEIEIETELGLGTTFTLKLPLTLSIIDGLLVEVDNIKYIIQLSVIEKIHKIEHAALSESFNDILVLDNEQIPYVYLREYFACTEAIDTEHVIIIEYEDKKVGIIVDDVIGEYQAVLKPLGHHYRKQEIFSGGTILGDGNIALVLDTNKIVREKNK